MSISNSNISPLIYRSQPNPAIHQPGTLATPVELTIFDDGESHRRHDRQLSDGKIAKLNDSLPGLIIDAREYCACYEVPNEVWMKSKALNGEPAFQPYLYLFNVLIAFEWDPSPSTVQRVRSAAKKASDFLYDVTDGFMAIGQVILGGRDLLHVADIQVMASNRFHPRSWISALHEPHKYQPIRVGRGLWRKDQGFVVPWDESDSHRVLVHEWGHYALELADEYLNLVRLERSRGTQRQWRGTPVQHLSEPQRSNSLDIVAPSIAPPIDSIMSTLASSELIPRHEPASSERRKYMLKKIQKHFPKVTPKRPLEGPTELPLPDLPVFLQQPNLSNAPEEVRLSSINLQMLMVSLVSSLTPETAGNSWVYVRKPDGRIIGQGVISDRDLNEGFDLLGAAENDEIVVVAQTANPSSLVFQVQVKRAQVGAGGQIGPWLDVTPDELPDFVDVLPVRDGGQEQLPTKLRIQIETQTSALPSEVWVAALGQTPKPLTEDYRERVTYPDGNPRTRWVSKGETFFQLDGHVLLRWGNKMYICNYSHGGGPCSGAGGRCVCYTAGSYEGNSMVFFRDNYDASDVGSNALQPELVPMTDKDNVARIVATVMHNGPQYLQRVASAPTLAPAGTQSAGDSVDERSYKWLPVDNTAARIGTQITGDIAEARSYIFSLASNHALGELPATLVLYYDNSARKRGGDLLVYRWTEGDSWKQLTTYTPEDQPYVCIPLDTATPETSGGKNSRANEYFDRYRIYWTPR